MCPADNLDNRLHMRNRYYRYACFQRCMFADPCVDHVYFGVVWYALSVVVLCVHVCVREGQSGWGRREGGVRERERRTDGRTDRQRAHFIHSRRKKSTARYLQLGNVSYPR